MTDIAALFLSLAGFALLMLSMARHQQDWLGRKLATRPGKILRLSGYGALALSLAMAFARYGWAYGMVDILGFWTLAAGLVVLANCNRGRIMGFARRASK